VLGHGTVLSKEASIEQIALHLQRLEQIDELILGLVERARSMEEIIYAVLRKVGVKDNLAQYWLAVTTIKGHLSGLVSRFRVAYEITDHRVYWKLNE
jgi:hypothetical protein